jgi:aminoglycoside phosphotransferase (APT) family kinase protein
LQEAAERALAKAQADQFLLHSRVMHGDLWLGNVMLDPSKMREFMIIDWGGSSVDGLPIFDLVKFAESAGLPPRVLNTELVAHAERLGCSLEQTRIYLVAALGYTWQNLNQFPPERFKVMAENSLRTIDEALNA